MPKIYIPDVVKLEILKLSNGYCEYCLHPENYATDFFQFDHIVPLSEGGDNSLGNLARSCGFCNSFKKQKTYYYDSSTGSDCSIFNPRKDTWIEHFEWSDDCLLVLGLTATARATIDLLHLNRQNLQNLRRVLHKSGLHPPKFFI